MTLPILWMMFEGYMRDIVKHWYGRAIGQNVEFDTVDRFISLWIAFNAWGTYKSGKEKDRDMLETLKKDQELIDSFEALLKDGKSFVKDLDALKAKCPISRSRSRKHGESVTITDVRDLSQVLEAIYTVRCNLFHGKKLFQEERDKELVRLALKILRKIFGGLQIIKEA